MKKEFRLMGNILIILILIYSLGKIYINEKPDDLYIKMNEITENQKLIESTLEEVIELLGKPEYESKDRKNKKQFMYYAGKVVQKTFLGNTNVWEYYELWIYFDENDKVEDTYIKLRS